MAYILVNLLIIIIFRWVPRLLSAAFLPVYIVVAVVAYYAIVGVTAVAVLHP